MSYRHEKHFMLRLSGGGRGDRIPLDTMIASQRRSPLLPPNLVYPKGIEPLANHPPYYGYGVTDRKRG